MHSKETITSAGSMDTLRNNVGVRTMEGQRKLNVHKVERNIMDSVGQGAAHHPIKIHRKEDGKETEKETAREPRKVESSTVEKAETMGKEKVKARRDNVSTPPEEQWTGGSWEQWLAQTWSAENDTASWRDDDWYTADSAQTWSAENDTASWRDDDWYTADSNSQTSAATEECQRACVGDLRHSNLGCVKHVESFQHDRWGPSQRTITLGIDTAACKTVVPTNHPATRGYLVHKDSLLGCAYSTAGRDKVYDQGKRNLCTLDETGKPMAIERRKVDCRRPLMAVTEMTDCGRWVCFGPQRQGFSFDPRTGQKIEFTPTPDGWDLTMELEPL